MDPMLCYLIQRSIKMNGRWISLNGDSSLQPLPYKTQTSKFAQNLIWLNFHTVCLFLSIFVSHEICSLNFYFFDIISMAAIIPCHYCASLSPKWFNSNNTHSRRLSYPLRGLRGFNARCSYQPPHHSESPNNHVSLLDIWFFFFFNFRCSLFYMNDDYAHLGLEMWCPISNFFI